MTRNHEASPLQRLTALWTRPDRRFIRFFMVGVVGVGVSTTVLWLTVRAGGLPAPVGGVCAAVISTFTNFLLNDAFTWRDRRSPSLRAKAVRLVRYYATTAAGNLVYVTVLTILTHSFKLYVLFANVGAIAAGGTLNYVLHNRWTWRKFEPHS